MIGIFLDSETTGLDPRQHSLIEIAFVFKDLLTGKTLKTFNSLVGVSKSEWQKSDPKSLEINGFTWEMLQNAPSASVVRQHILESFQEVSISRKNAVFICQNPSFDRSFFGNLIDPITQERLYWPYHWLDLASMHWALALKNPKSPLPWEVGCSKDKIATFLGLEKEKMPHRALNGVEHLILCYENLVGFPAGIHNMELN